MGGGAWVVVHGWMGRGCGDDVGGGHNGKYGSFLTDLLILRTVHKDYAHCTFYTDLAHCGGVIIYTYSLEHFFPVSIHSVQCSYCLLQ